MENLPSFTMHGCREILTLAGEQASYLKKQIELLEDSVGEAPELAVDLAKSLIETICKTILEDRGVVIEREWLRHTPMLFDNTLSRLQFLPEEHNASPNMVLGLHNTLKGLRQTVSGLCEIRNIAGIASHGKDGYTPPFDNLQAIFAAKAADVVVHFLYIAHRTYPSHPSTGRLHYHNNAEFNNYIDSVFGPFGILGSNYNASEVLYYTDLEAYRAALLEYKEMPKETEQDEQI